VYLIQQDIEIAQLPTTADGNTILQLTATDAQFDIIQAFE
jgi:hypothetical protein